MKKEKRGYTPEELKFYDNIADNGLIFKQLYLGEFTSDPDYDAFYNLWVKYYQLMEEIDKVEPAHSNKDMREKFRRAKQDACRRHGR